MMTKDELLGTVEEKIRSLTNLFGDACEVGELLFASALFGEIAGLEWVRDLIEEEQ